MIRQLVGDCRETLRTLPADSAQTCVTSPPYYGLRDYGTDPLVWGGDPEHVHDFMETQRYFENRKAAAVASGIETKGELGGVTPGVRIGAWRYGDCPCGAWLGSLGLEPTPDLFIAHLVEVFREVRRVLRPDGTLWVNLGDSYAGSGKGPSNSLNLSNPHAHLAAEAMKLQRIGPQEHTIGHGRVPGLKPKDLMLMPARVAMALQADGWWLRSMIPWLKRNAMPESVTDRPATSVEYVFLLSKSARYFWDADAVRVKVGEPTRRNAEFRGVSVYKDHIADGIGNSAQRPEGKSSPGPASMDGRNRRNSDWFFESWQGLMLDEQDDPLALVVNPMPFKGSHFATFPPKLVEPMLKASTRPGDTVLDCFGGAGTVGLVADRLGRNAVICELKPEYGAMAAGRLTGDAPLFVELGA